MNYFITILIAFLSGYTGYLLARRKDYISIKRSIYIESIPKFDKEFFNDDKLLAQINFLAGDKLRKLIEWHKFLIIFKNFFDSKLKHSSEKKESLDLILNKIKLVFPVLIDEIKNEMKNEIRARGNISNFRYLEEEVNEIRQLIENK